jgi:hypothetical protein
MPQAGDSIITLELINKWHEALQGHGCESCRL